jgi:hypothetical protein
LLTKRYYRKGFFCTPELHLLGKLAKGRIQENVF